MTLDEFKTQLTAILSDNEQKLLAASAETANALSDLFETVEKTVPDELVREAYGDLGLKLIAAHEDRIAAAAKSAS